MADDDEIDILGDFSFNSCLAQNSQGIPSCSNREDTVHPQWFLDSTANNWYDLSKDSNRNKDDPHRRPTSRNSSPDSYNNQVPIVWTKSERELLMNEMRKYGRNIQKISQTLKTKSEAEIQALIEAEFGVHLETPTCGLEKHLDQEGVPTVVQEEVVTDDTNFNNIIQIFTTGAPTVQVPKRLPFKKKNVYTKSKNSLLKPNLPNGNNLQIDPSEILFEDDLVVGSTESIGSEFDSADLVSKNITKYQSAKKKIGNHRRKVSRNFGKAPFRNKSKELKSSPGRQRKDSSLSEDSAKSPKLQIVLGSGQALPISEGEQIIKIEKKKDSDPESDIDIDVDSDNDNENNSKSEQKGLTVHNSASFMGSSTVEAPIAVPLRNFEPMPRRKKKINLDGGGGYTIMHTSSGDLYSVSAEPSRVRGRRRPPPARLLLCRPYSVDTPAPYTVHMHVSALLSMDAHAHTSRAEVMGLAGGEGGVPGGPGGVPGAPGGPGGVPGGPGGRLCVRAYRPAAAAACGTHCDMDPVSQASAGTYLRSLGLQVVGWHHSHPAFPAAPSALDLRQQAALQRAFERNAPFLGFITAPFWTCGRVASQYRCFRVDDTENPDEPTGFQFSVKLVPDITEHNLQRFTDELRDVLRSGERNEYSVDMEADVCPQAQITYLEKFISSASHHLKSAGYQPDDPLVPRLLQNIRDIFR